MVVEENFVGFIVVGIFGVVSNQLLLDVNIFEQVGGNGQVVLVFGRMMKELMCNYELDIIISYIKQ